MNISLDLQIASEDDDHPPPTAIRNWVATALNIANWSNPTNQAELTVRVVSPAEITELNKRYRNSNKATNVLSFPAELPDHIELPLLGDLVVCAAVVAQEARTQHKPKQAHWAHMIIHGTLHLLGFDHIDDDDAELMEGLEIACLASLNIANPYLNHKTAATTP